MSHRVWLLVLAFLLLGGGGASVHAQEADSLTADTTAADTMAVEAATPDTTVRDTGDAAPDTTRMAADTTKTDTLTAAQRAAIQARKDSIQARQDSLQARRDSIVNARTQKGRQTAEEWLSLTDAGHFERSWEMADSTLKKNVSREFWIDQGRRTRNRLDTMRSRELTQSTYRDSTERLPGSTPVVTLQYATEFDRGKTLEAVVATKRDTAWTVAGYRVVPRPDTTQSDTIAADTVETDTTQETDDAAE